MTAKTERVFISALFFVTLVACGCGSHKPDPAAEGPVPAQVEHEQDGSLIQTDHPEQFPLFTATSHQSSNELVVTGVVTPDISRNVPVVTLASGRVVEIDARLGDTVKKGQLLLRVQSDDISGAFADYRKAVADEALAKTQLDRAKDLFAHGANSQNDLQVAQDTGNKAEVDVETKAEHLKLLGGNVDHPTGIVDIVAPVSGVITDQQVTAAGGVQGLGSSPFTVSDLSRVWIVCDVHENDLPSVRQGDSAAIRLDAYPDRPLTGRIGNIGAVLDPTVRTAKVRIEVGNPGIIRVGMFVSATFRSQLHVTHAAIPAAAILHLHDRDWVFVAASDNKFQRVEITAGGMLPQNMQEVVSGIDPGTKVVQNALVLQNASEQ